MKIKISFGSDSVASEKEAKPQDFKKLFFQETKLTARCGKTVYISKQHHEWITKIVQVIGKNEVSIFSYINNVLEHHFSTYREDINNLYDSNLESKVF
jgi:hypothetical protein